LGMLTQDLLSDEGYTVHLCRDGKEGLQKFHEHAYSLCLLDVMMPKKDGFSLAEDIRKVNEEVPIVFLTAREMAEDKVKGFKVGADDYITKPFDSQEFTLRIKAILKRTGQATSGIADERLMTLGAYQFDTLNYNLSGPGGEKHLTKKEAELLKALMLRKGQVIERELLTNLVWGDDNYFVGRSMDVFISKLRKYLSDDPNITITNIHGIGFKLEDGH
jgi:DNA-binding response OmpR family regulator